ncbi:hypothetical protein C8J57DRAFT_1240523 [Mycena rebaudengoi]|nr:hypothetical protein C8J57DRAFT_1240523 [Mycena rebaudengoi]
MASEALRNERARGYFQKDGTLSREGLPHQENPPSRLIYFKSNEFSGCAITCLLLLGEIGTNFLSALSDLNVPTFKAPTSILSILFPLLHHHAAFTLECCSMRPLVVFVGAISNTCVCFALRFNIFTMCTQNIPIIITRALLTTGRWPVSIRRMLPDPE